MKPARYVPVWWIPSLLVVAPALGFLPAHRDLMDFFAPMRAFTAAALRSGTAPWLNLGNGCGEAWFANPETVVLYPVAWVHLVLPLEFAFTIEIAFHLSWFALGAGLLARHYGAEPGGRMAVEAASWSAGPILFTVGVLNNLETLAWLPWLVLAARQRDRLAIPLVAVTCALAWLGGEPQIWAMGVAFACLAARSRLRAAAGALLGIAIVSVQLVPFVAWVIEGNRGPNDVAWVLRGALAPTDWLGLLLPWIHADLGRMIYVESLYVGAPLMVLMLLGSRRQPWLMVAAAILGLLATLPEIGGGSIFLAVTQGMVRYPSRFAVVALALLLPMIGRGFDEWLAGGGRRLALALAVSTLLLCVVFSNPLRWLVAGVPALLLLGGALPSAKIGIRKAAVVAGITGSMIAAWPLLGLQPSDGLTEPSSPWPEAISSGRVYSPTPTVDDMSWFTSGLASRRAWPIGYLNLLDGLELVRTDSPVANGALMDHLRITDEGPHRRWWLDALAAEWVILPVPAGVPEAMESVRQVRGMRLLRNRMAWPKLQVTSDPPEEEEEPRAAGRVVSFELAGNRCVATIEADVEAWIVISMAPVRGWNWTIDGTEVQPLVGPGVLQSLRIQPGRHLIEGVYRPPWLLVSATVSAISTLLALGMLMVAARSRFRAPPDTLE